MQNRIIMNIVCAAADVIQKISIDSSVRGVTSVDDELFVLLQRADNQVGVYSINDYQLLRRINLPGFKPNGTSDIASCVRHKCLYASETDKTCIHRYELANCATSKWSVPGRPRGLSVTPGGNLLVTFHGKLVELSSDSGECVREIALQSDIVCPWHSVQLTTGEVVICHGVYDGDIHRVCEVGDDGKVARSYGGKHGSDIGQLHLPCRLAVDEDSQFIFVVDELNARVALLSPTLGFVRYVIEGVSCPCRLYFHQATRRLFIGQWRALSVVQLSMS